MRGIHRKIELACKAINLKKNKKAGDQGYIMYADIKGDGSGFKPRLYYYTGRGGVSIHPEYAANRDTLAKLLAYLVEKVQTS